MTDYTEADELPVTHLVPVVACAWCGEVSKWGQPGQLVSHTICPDCKAQQAPELERLRRERHAQKTA